MRAFSNAVLSTHPRIDLLVSNAGGLREIDFTHEDLQSLDLTADTRSNLDGAIHLISGFLPDASAPGGRRSSSSARATALQKGGDGSGDDLIVGGAADAFEAAKAAALFEATARSSE